MILRNHGKAHDTSDGSEHPDGPQLGEQQGAGRTAKQNWADDGGPTNEGSVHVPSEVGQKPSWSVLSLRDLNEAIEKSRRADDWWRVHQEAQRLRDAQSAVARAAEAKAAAAVRAKRDFYRNPWEHT